MERRCWRRTPAVRRWRRCPRRAGRRSRTYPWAPWIMATRNTRSMAARRLARTARARMGVAVSPDGSTAYVANSGSNSVTAIDTATFATRQIRMPRYSYPSSIAISPDGSHVYVAGDNLVPDFGNTPCFVFVIDTGSGEVVDSIKVPYPMALTVSPDGTKIYVVGGFSYLYTIST